MNRYDLNINDIPNEKALGLDAKRELILSQIPSIKKAAYAALIFHTLTN